MPQEQPFPTEFQYDALWNDPDNPFALPRPFVEFRGSGAANDPIIVGTPPVTPNLKKLTLVPLAPKGTQEGSIN